ncbi:hypothetical protein FACS1894147_10450 [Spirochaetia bacterium]|nr:hypothetical protein FACS1894147_10450 [Spirochaetia bacterium]
MKKLITLTLLLTAAFALTTCGSTESATVKTTNGTRQAAAAPVRYFEGNGGKGTSIAILPPQGVGLSKDLDYLPALVQGEFVSNFSGYSAIDVLDRVALEAQYAELLSGYYPDDAKGVITLGHLPPTTYLMMGKITKTSSGYALQITVAKNADGATAAAYSGTCTVAELDDLTGIRRSSQELLEKMGVELNAQGKQELAGSAIQQAINAQTALAKGITAQRSGTTVEALSYYMTSVNYDPSLAEAASRVNILSADISSGSIGENVRNDIQWRKDWEARLKECEEYFANYMKNPPYTVVYSTDVKQGKVDYERERVDISIDIYLIGDPSYFKVAENVVNKVRSGLAATGRAEAWGLRTNVASTEKLRFNVQVELLNENDKVIGRSSASLDYGWRIDYTRPKETGSAGRIFIDCVDDERSWVTFRVNANEVSDKLSVRIAGIVGHKNEKVENVSFIPYSEYLKASPYKVGDTGPAGGIIIEDRGYRISSDLQIGSYRYTEIAPVETEFKSKEPAERIASLNIGGYWGWRLPLLKEMKLIYDTPSLKERCGFKNAKYWAATQVIIGRVFQEKSFNLGNGETDYAAGSLLTRVVRTF